MLLRSECGLTMTTRATFLPLRHLRGPACIAAALIVSAAGAVSTVAAPFATPPRPAGSVYDGAHVLQGGDLARIEALSRELWERAHVALVVATLPDLGGDTVEEVSIRIAKEWGIGGKESRGVLILAAIGDRKARIETGYGVEGFLP